MTTKILMREEKVRREDGGPVQRICMFALEDDGIILGGVQEALPQGGQGMFGDGDDRMVKQFVTYEYAIKWVKAQIALKAGREDLDYVHLPSHQDNLVELAKPNRRF